MLHYNWFCFIFSTQFLLLLREVFVERNSPTPLFYSLVIVFAWVQILEKANLNLLKILFWQNQQLMSSQVLLNLWVLYLGNLILMHPWVCIWTITVFISRSIWDCIHAVTHKLWELWFRLELPQLSSYPLQTMVELIQALNGMPFIVSPLLRDKNQSVWAEHSSAWFHKPHFLHQFFNIFNWLFFCLKTSSLQIADDIKHWIRDQRAKTTTFLDLCNSSMNKTLFKTEFPLLKKLNT